MDWFEKVAGREGVEEALRKARAYGDGRQDVLRPLQEVEIDHWTVNLRTILTRVGIWPKLTRNSRRRLEKVRMTLGRQSAGGHTAFSRWSSPAPPASKARSA